MTELSSRLLQFYERANSYLKHDKKMENRYRTFIFFAEVLRCFYLSVVHKDISAYLSRGVT